MCLVAWLVHLLIVACTSTLVGTCTGNYRDTCSLHTPTVSALILARAGSKGILHKNLAVVGNLTLLGRTITTLQNFGRFASIWVSTDGDAIAKEANDHGALVHSRHPDTATDTATSIAAAQEFLQYHPEIDILAIIQCTSPFLKSEFLDEAFQLILEGDVDCVFSVTISHHLRWITAPGTDAFVKPLNFDPRNRPRRQDWAGELVENGMFYIGSRNLVDSGRFQNNRCKVVKIPEEYALEIDTEEDLERARLEIQRRIP